VVEGVHVGRLEALILSPSVPAFPDGRRSIPYGVPPGGVGESEATSAELPDNVGRLSSLPISSQAASSSDSILVFEGPMVGIFAENTFANHRHECHEHHYGEKPLA
jgi:hypothetical protein